MLIWLALIALTGFVIWDRNREVVTKEDLAIINDSVQHRSTNNFLLDKTESWWGKE